MWGPGIFHKPSRWFLALLKPWSRAFFYTSDPGILANWRMEVLQVWTRRQGVDSVKEGTERHRGCVWRVLEILVWNVLGNTTVEVWPWLWVTEAKCKWKWFLTPQGSEVGLRPPGHRGMSIYVQLDMFTIYNSQQNIEM